MLFSDEVSTEGREEITHWEEGAKPNDFPQVEIWWIRGNLCIVMRVFSFVLTAFIRHSSTLGSRLSGGTPSGCLCSSQETCKQLIFCFIILKVHINSFVRT